MRVTLGMKMVLLGLGAVVSGVAMGAAAQGAAPTVVVPPAQSVTPVQAAAPVAAVPPKPVMPNVDWAQFGRYRADNATLPVREAGRVVFFGDSITDAWKRNGGAFFPGKPYVNRGISGQTTQQMLVRFREDVVNLHPEVVVFLAGTNDLAGNTGLETQEMIADNFRSMVEIARANGIRVVLGSVLPAGDYPWRRGLEPAPKIVALNKWLAQYAAEQGLVYLDYYTSMATPEGAMKPELSKDGVHPNAAGYAVMEPLAQAAIDKAMQGPVAR